MLIKHLKLIKTYPGYQGLDGPGARLSIQKQIDRMSGNGTLYTDWGCCR